MPEQALLGEQPAPRGRPLRVVFMGTSAFATGPLEAAARSRHELIAVYTQPPRPAGRGHKERRTEVHEAALALGLDVRTPERLRAEQVQDLRALAPDLVLVASYGLLLPRSVLDVPPLGSWNLHASILPRWRGAAPIQRAILAGDGETGISIFLMEEGLDTGPIAEVRAIAIEPAESARSLHARLSRLAAEMVPGFLDRASTGSLRLEPQPNTGVSYAHKLTKSEATIDWRHDALAIERQVRAFDPWPGAWCSVGGERLRILRGRTVEGAGEPGEIIGAPLTIACGRGALAVERLQRQGRAALEAADFLRGFDLPLGTRLDLAAGNGGGSLGSGVAWRPPDDAG